MNKRVPDNPMLSAFVSGLYMGLAAPALLLCSLMTRPIPSVEEALTGDWKRLGGDMRAAITKVGRESGPGRRAA